LGQNQVYLQAWQSRGRAGTGWKMVYRSGPAGNGPVGIICPTAEIPVKTGEKVTIFLENNFLQKNDPNYEII